MAETIPGGVYKNAVGDGYHDAHGNPVDASKVAEWEELNRQQVARIEALTPSVPPSTVDVLSGLLRQAITPQVVAPPVVTPPDDTVITPPTAPDDDGKAPKK